MFGSLGIQDYIWLFYGITAIHLAMVAVEDKRGWLLGIFNQFIWTIWLIATKKYVFIVVKFVFSAIFLYGYQRQVKKEKQTVTPVTSVTEVPVDQTPVQDPAVVDDGKAKLLSKTDLDVQ